MNDHPKETEDEKKTADMYHFERKSDRRLFIGFVIILVLVAFYLFVHFKTKAGMV